MKRWRVKRRRDGLGLVVVAVMVVTGCGSPPSVLPLLEVSERAIKAEAERLKVDSERDQLWMQQTRAALERAYEMDLAEQEVLEASWVRSATAGYVMAREELLRHELALRAERVQRAENLHDAAEAVRRAGAILQQRDLLADQMIGERVRRWVAN